MYIMNGENATQPLEIRKSTRLSQKSRDKIDNILWRDKDYVYDSGEEEGNDEDYETEGDLDGTESIDGEVFLKPGKSNSVKRKKEDSKGIKR